MTTMTERFRRGRIRCDRWKLVAEEIGANMSEEGFDFQPGGETTVRNLLRKVDGVNFLLEKEWFANCEYVQMTLDLSPIARKELMAVFLVGCKVVQPDV